MRTLELIEEGFASDTIIIIDIVDSTTTNAAGNKLKETLDAYFIANTPVYLSFENINSVSSSFFNSSFGALFETYGIVKFKEVVKPVCIRRSILDNLQRWLKAQNGLK